MLVIALLCLVSVHTSFGAQFYLSPAGSDSNPGTAQKPWRNIVRAQQGVRSLRPGGSGPLPGPVTIFMAPGPYAPASFSPQDSGDSSAKVTYQGFGSGQATITGGQFITNWTSIGNNVWRTSDVGSADYVRQLWVNGVRVSVAQTPILYYEKEEQGPNGQSRWIQYKSGDINPSWKNFKDIEVVLYHSWTASVHQIANIDPVNRTLYFKNSAFTRWDIGASGSRYFLINVFERMRHEQFYFDKSQRTLYYHARDGQNPNQLETIVADSLEVLTITGTPSQKVKFLEFNNLFFSHTQVEVASCFSGTCDGQSASFLNTATVHLHYSDNIQFHNITISHTGGYAIWIHEGSNDNVITYLHATDLGAGAVRIGVPSGGVVPSSLLSLRNTVNDSTLEHGGYFYEEGCGVLLQGASDNTIAQNEIRYFKYTGVSIGWTWDYSPTSQKNNFIAFNEIHHIGESFLSDMGCIYSLGISPGTRVYNNLCHDVSSYNYGGWGLYTDQASSYITIENNIVYRTKCAGIHQHFGENNLFKNNIVAFAADDPSSLPHCTASVRSSQWAPGSGIGDHSSFSFQNNIVYISDSDLFLTTNSIGFNNMTFDRNVYWSTSHGSDLSFPPSQKPTTFHQWQQEGKDIHSVLADPMFVDPKNLNFNLKPGSPALKLGFIPINTANIGPRKKM